jgi:hypothetical protein
MEVTGIRKELQEYIDKGDEKLLRMLYALAKEYNDDDNTDLELHEDDINEFENRRAKRLSGESKLYDWQEAKQIITGKRKID